jgi:capsular polysaccharide biosynthesis protein
MDSTALANVPLDKLSLKLTPKNDAALLKLTGMNSTMLVNVTMEIQSREKAVAISAPSIQLRTHLIPDTCAAARIRLCGIMNVGVPIRPCQEAAGTDM